MAKMQPLTVDFRQENEVLQILPRPPLRSSANLGWRGVYVQQHQQPAWEAPECASINHIVLIQNPNVTLPAERSFDGRRQQEQIGGINNIVIVPATVLHEAKWNQESLFSLVFIEPDYLSQVARESVMTDRVQLMAHFAMHDPFIHQIGRSLITELDADQSHSRLFVDSLTIALSIHLLRHYSDLQQPLREDANRLPQRKLRQAIAYINEHLTTDLTIAAIADELEISQYYFSRLFKQSTGVSPYQYVMQQRIERAKYLLRTTSLSVAAIALKSGFSNQNQLTIQFRKFTGTTPTKYRQQH